MATIIDTLVFDRTAEDVERVKTLKSQIMTYGLSSLSQAERTEYLAGMKGAYNYTDMNRVGQAVAFLAQRLTALPGELEAYRASIGVGEDAIFNLPYNPDQVSVNPKTDWSVTDIPTVSQIKTYLANISNLRSILALPSGTPSPPSNLNAMTYTTANNLEKILSVIYQAFLKIEAEEYDLIDRAALDHWLAGEVYAGEI